jgi:hypothetical protein
MKVNSIALLASLNLAALNLAAQIPLERFYDDGPALRQSALQQFASLPSHQKAAYLAPLLKLIQNGSDVDGQQAYRLEPVLARIGPVAIPQLLPLLDASRTVQGFAAGALAMIRLTDPGAIAKLREMLNEEDFGLRGLVAESIIREEARGSGEAVSAEGVPSLLTALKSENSLDAEFHSR